MSNCFFENYRSEMLFVTFHMHLGTRWKTAVAKVSKVEYRCFHFQAQGDVHLLYKNRTLRNEEIT